MPEIGCVLPVAGWPIHRSMPWPVELVKANCFPSGLHTGGPSFGSLGRGTAMSAPPEIRLIEYPMTFPARCIPLAPESMRSPARRRIGCATSALGEDRNRRMIIDEARDGLTQI